MERNRGVRIRSKGLQNRIAENIKYSCNVEGCPRNRWGISRYCQYHAQQYRCKGYPTPPHFTRYRVAEGNYIYQACQKLYNVNLHTHKGLAETMKRFKQEVFMADMTQGNHLDWRWWLAWSLGKEERAFVSGCCVYANLAKTTPDFIFHSDTQFDFSLARSMILVNFNEQRQNRKLIYGRAIREYLKWLEPYRLMMLNLGTAAVRMIENEEQYEDICMVPIKVPVMKPKKPKTKTITRRSKNE